MSTVPPLTDFVSTKIAPAKKQPVGLIETKNLSLFYGLKQVLQSVCLPIEAGKITAIVGPSGCGKTSLISTLNRLTDLIPDCRISGRVLFEGSDIHAPEVDVIQLRRRIGMIFQNPAPFPFSIKKNICFPLREHGIKDRKEQTERLETVLRDVGLWDEVKDRLTQNALTLSGGQQQRLCIARALALKPQVLLMDEPCAALDPLSSAVVEDLIAALKEHYTIVIVTHNLAQAKRISDATAFFWSQNGMGRLIEQGGTKQVFEAPQNALTAAYISGVRG